MKRSRQNQPNLYLAGFMGTGKTALGRRLARRWNIRFVDSDFAIEEAAKKSISEIFAQEGEEAFRERERAFLEGGHPECGCVVSLGGGTVCRPGAIDLLKRKGVLVCLFASPQTIWERVRRATHRPLLAVEDPKARIAQLLAEREPYYRAAGTGILTDGLPLARLVARVAGIYEKQARAFLRNTPR